MKRILLTFGLGIIISQAPAQLVNNGAIHVSDGALVTVDMEIVNNGSIENHGDLVLKNNINNNASFLSKGNLALRSEAGIRINGNQDLNTTRLLLESDVQLENTINVNKLLSFNSGYIFTSDKGRINFGTDADYSSASDYSHIVGVVSKTGEGSFVFPLGDGYTQKFFEISDLNGKKIEASYVGVSPLEISSELEDDVAEISSQEYWTIKADNASKLDVSLANNEVISLKHGLWTNSRKGLNIEREGTVFTSGRTKNIVKEIGVWPNPTAGEFNLKLSGMKDSDNITVDITNQDGRMIQSLKGKVQDLRKAYRLPSGLVATSLKVRVINGNEVLTQTLILQK